MDLEQLEYKAKAIKAIVMALADAVDDFIKATNEPDSHRLTVQWVGQNTSRTDDDYTNSDCGAAVVAMLVKHSVDEVSVATGKPRDYKFLSFNDLIKAAAIYGLRLQHVSLTLAEICAEIDRNNPVIVLVNYQSLPAPCRYDAKYNGGHYLLVVGYDDKFITYHDPYWPSDLTGEYKQLTRDEFLTAYTTVAPGNQYASHALRILS